MKPFATAYKICLAALLLCVCLPLCACRGAAGTALPASVAPSVQLPVIMYHSVLKDPERNGKYVVSPAELEGDLAYLARQGYTAVLPCELIAYAEGRGALPQLPVLITFDDGHYNNLTYALPLLEKYDMKALISPVGTYTETYSASPDPNPNYAYCSWDELTLLCQSGRFELGNHSFDMHAEWPRKGASRKKNESAVEYQAAFISDTQALQTAMQQHCGVLPAVYAYPFGAISPENEALLVQLGFSCSLSCRERVNTVTFSDPGCLWQLGRFNRPGGESTLSFMQRALP